MRVVGELALLTAFVSSGFAASVFLITAWRDNRLLRRAGSVAAVNAFISLSAVMAVLAWALYHKDFTFDYVAQYSSRLLSWQYSLSALWVGQAGSLLLWSWFVAVLAVMLRWWRGRGAEALRVPAAGVLMGYVCFLAAMMMFAADPMAASVAAPSEGIGLSPLLQHPAMLIHPPIVFLGYSLWTVPFAVAIAALLTNRLDLNWLHFARPWALLAWAVLGIGILLGAEWAYEELGWGGYWAWDPVENGSLLPWLTGTALIHGLMAWQYRQILKKTSIALAFVTFGLCNFATFLTRSGVFSSLHAFSQSPIGWLFLAMMFALGIVAIVLLARRWPALKLERSIPSLLSREACLVAGSLALLLLTAVVLGGTLSSALSSLATGKTILVGPAFYNNVLIPIGLLLLSTMSVAPLLSWGAAPNNRQIRWLVVSGCIGLVTVAIAAAAGVRHPILLAVIGLAAISIAALAGGLVLDSRTQDLRRLPFAMLMALRVQRRQYASFLIHLGFAALALGVTASSVGKHEQNFKMVAGETVRWGARQIRLVEARQRDLPDKLIAEAELEIHHADQAPVKLLPAQHYHRLQQQWTTEVAIHSTWAGDVYAILHSGNLEGQLYLTLIENPLMRWIWAGGAIMALGTAVRLWPVRRRRRKRAGALPAVADISPAQHNVPPQARSRKAA